MMSAEGVGLSIGFASLFITIVGVAVAGGTAYGKILTVTNKTADKVEEIDRDNRLGHKEIFDCQKATDIKVEAIVEHLRAINGSIQHNGEEHKDILVRIATLERERLK